MPWSSVTVQEQREEFVRLASRADANVSELCRRYGISRKTGYKWLAREDLGDRSRRPQESPRQTPEAVEKRVLAVRREHPAWGGRKIAHVLQRDAGIQIAPSTVTSVLHRHGLVSDAGSEAATPWKRFEHAVPNDLWQMDFKGHFATDSGRCHPLTVLDDHSRFSVVLQALNNERRESVQTQLQRAFERYGLPQQINVDNGAPWGSPHDGSPTMLEMWLLRLGVSLTHSRPYHPQTNGKDERFHRSMQAEVISTRRFRDVDDAQHHLGHWRHVYNHHRPHEALGMHTPASRYSASRRPCPPGLPPIEYAPGDIVRTVREGGRIKFKGHVLRVGRSLLGLPVGLRPTTQDGVFDVFFCHRQIRRWDLADTDLLA